MDAFSRIILGDQLWFTGSTYASRKARRQAILHFDHVTLQRLEPLLAKMEARGAAALVGPKEMAGDEKFTVYYLS